VPLVAPDPQSTPTADDIIARYTKTVGGADKIQAIRTLRRIGKYTGDDGFEAIVIEESSRPNKVREEFSIQGMTGINAYDGTSGWKIDPWLPGTAASPAMLISYAAFAALRCHRGPSRTGTTARSTRYHPALKKSRATASPVEDSPWRARTAQSGIGQKKRSPGRPRVRRIIESVRWGA